MVKTEAGVVVGRTKRPRATYNVEEVAQMLGVAPASAYAAIRAGQIPSVCIGKRILIPHAAFHRMLEEQSDSEEGRS